MLCGKRSAGPIMILQLAFYYKGKRSICDFWFGEHEDELSFIYLPFDRDSGFGYMAYKDSILTLSIIQVWFWLCLWVK